MDNLDNEQYVVYNIDTTIFGGVYIMNNKQALKFYQKSWFMWLMLLFFAPVGVYLMWKNKKFPVVARWALSIFFVIWFIGTWVGSRYGDNSAEVVSNGAAQEVVKATQEVSAPTVEAQVAGEEPEPSKEPELLEDPEPIEEAPEEEPVLTFGSTFEFDGLEITIGESGTWSTLDNQFNEHNGKDVLLLPVTIKNTKSDSHGLNMFQHKTFGSTGTELDNLFAYFENNIDSIGELRSGAEATGDLCILYDGDGDYYLEFDSLWDKIEVKLPISK
jgi:hypothetical protein